MKKIIIIFFSFLIISGILVSWKKSLAENQTESKDFSINPFFQEINIAEGQDKVPFSMEATNNTDTPMVFRVSVLDFGTLNETGGVAFLGPMDNLKYSLASWINLQNDTLVINPGETQSVKGNIENRDSLSPGGHYGAIYLKNEDDSQAAVQQKVAFDSSLASLLFVRKIGGEIHALNLDSKDFSSSPFVLPDWVKLRFQNSGNMHVTPRGLVEIIDPLGRTVSKGIINEQSSIVLPETFRTLPIKMTDLTKAFVPGKYKFTISYRFDGKDDFIGDTTSFVYMPPLFIFGILSLLVLVSGLLYVWKINKK